MLPKVESEILQDANTTWRLWLKRSLKKGEDILDKLIAAFDEADIRPEIRDELWNAIGINVEINFPSHTRLPDSLFTPYYHRALIKKNSAKPQQGPKPVRVEINDTEAEQIIECGRMILIRHLREIDPITFTAAPLVFFLPFATGSFYSAYGNGV